MPKKKKFLKHWNQIEILTSEFKEPESKPEPEIQSEPVTETNPDGPPGESTNDKKILTNPEAVFLVICHPSMSEPWVT